MDAATLTALGSIAVGLAAAAGAVAGQRGANRTAQSGVVLGGYSTLVDNLQEERDQLRERLVEKEQALTAVYAELARERADRAALQVRINELTTELAELRARITELEGGPPL